MFKKCKIPNKLRSQCFGFSGFEICFVSEFVSDFDIRISDFLSLVSWRETILFLLPQPLRRYKTVAQSVFGNRPRFEKLQQVIRPARFGADPGKF
jgi:hypothetical protein